MSVQFHIDIRNGWLNLIESTIGASPVLQIRTGAPPSTLAAAATGTLLASLTLPADWMSAAASGSKALLGSWQDAEINATGTPGHFRLYEATTTTAYIQGTASEVDLGGDLEIDHVPITIGNPFTVVVWTFTASGA